MPVFDFLDRVQVPAPALKAVAPDGFAGGSIGVSATATAGGAGGSITPAAAPPSAAGAAAATPPSGAAVLPILPPNTSGPPGSLSGDATIVNALPRLAGQETEIVAPFQRHQSASENNAPGADQNDLQFRGRFVVELKPGASSENLARDHGGTHEFAYPNLDKNLNVWLFEGCGLSAAGCRKDALADSPDLFARRLRAHRDVLDAWPVYEARVEAASLLNDPLLPAQWHLANSGQTGGLPGLDANVPLAWDLGVTGRGVTIGVVDSGMQSTHPDLAPNYDPVASYDFFGVNVLDLNDDDDDPSPSIGDGICDGAGNTECHATAVAGVAAAKGDNGQGIAGAAPNARLGALRLIVDEFIGFDALANTLRWSTARADTGGGGFDGSRIDIYNNSWIPLPGNTISNWSPQVLSAVSESVRDGRGGLGSIYVFSAGNQREVGGRADYSDLHSRRHVIAVGAVAHDGQIAPYSSPGASVLISAPSGGRGENITTTDLITTGNSSSRADTPGYSRTNYASDLAGTSFSAPIVSGVIALMLEANPNLTYRDVQHILVNSASREGLTSASFLQNQAGRFFSHDYGFGLVNAPGAVHLAKNWRPVGPELVIDSGSQGVGQAIPDATGQALEDTVTVTGAIRVESVEVVFDATHPNRGDLQVELIHEGDTATVSLLADERPQDVDDNYSSYVFTSRAHWGESSAGTWRLRVRDNQGGNAGTWNNWQLRIFGTAMEPEPAPRVVNVNIPDQQIMQGRIADFQVQFDRPIDPLTFAPGDVTFTRNGFGGPANVTASSVTPVAGSNNTLFTVDVPDQDEAASYRIRIGPDINSSLGLQMDQDADPANGFTPHTQFYSLGGRLMFGRAAPAPLPGDYARDGETGLKKILGDINIPAGGIANADVRDLNVLFTAFHGFPSRDLLMRITSPDSQFIIAIGGNSANATGDPPDVNLGNIDGDAAEEFRSSTNGFWDTLLDDESPNDSIDAQREPNAYHYTDSYAPPGGVNRLDALDNRRIAGTWQVEIGDFREDNHVLFVHDYSLIITPSVAITDVRIDGVTNFDADRNLVEVAYTIGGVAPTSPVNFGVYASRDATLDFAGDTLAGDFTVDNTNCVGGANCLAVGSHVIKVDAAEFPDPEMHINHELFALVAADPDHRLLDPNRSNNTGVLMGVTEIPNDGTLWVAGDPYGADTVTIDGANSQVTFTNLNNNNAITFMPANVTDVFVGVGLGDDTVTASAVSNWMVLAMLGGGDDTYTGGSQIDAVLGGAGHDQLTGAGGNDRLFGVEGNDSLDGGEGNDLLSVGVGSPGLQTLAPGAGSDALLISGTPSSDDILIWDPDQNTAAAGPMLRASLFSPVNPPAGTNAVALLSLVINNVDASDRLLVSGAAGNDRIRLENPSPNSPNSRVGLAAVISGGLGDDEIFDGLGPDTIYGDNFTSPRAGDGNDAINTNDGAAHDIVYAGGGANTCISGDGDTRFNC